MYFSSGNLFAHAFMLILLINLHSLPLRIVHLRRERDAAEETGLRKYMKARSAGGFQKSDNTNGIAAMRWIFSSLRLKRAMRHSTP